MKNFCFLILSLLILSACQKDDLGVSSDGLTILPQESVTALVAGQVLDEDDAPLATTRITVGTQNTVTDENGFFLFPGLVMNQAGTAIQVQKEGFFNYVTWVYPAAGSQNFVRVNLLRKQVVASFMASEGGVFDIEGVRVDLPASAYVNAAGEAYGNRVEVAARWLNAADPDQSSSLAGSSLGLAEDGTYQSILQTGTLMLELLSPAGEKLALAGNTTAKLQIPLAEKWRGGVTPERPMWYLDEKQGIWIQDGMANWQGDYYEVEVSHFTFWCCSPPYPAVSLRGRLTTEEGEPIVQRNVSMEVANTGLVQGGVLTNGIGEFRGFAPEGEELRMIVWNACGEEAYSEDIGSFTITTDLGTFTLSNEYYFQFTGQALDCNFDPLPNAFVTVRFNGYNRTYIADEGGNYAAGLYLCAESGSTVPFELRLADINTGLISPWLSRELTHDMNFSTQLACDTPAEDFIEVQCAGETRVFLTPEAVLDYTDGFLTIWDTLNVVGQGGASTEFNVFGYGDLFPESEETLSCVEVDYNFTLIDGDRIDMFCHETSSNLPCSGFNLTITENQGPGGYIGGVFNGVLVNTNNNNTETPLNGRFRIRQQ